MKIVHRNYPIHASVLLVAVASVACGDDGPVDRVDAGGIDAGTPTSDGGALDAAVRPDASPPPGFDAGGMDAGFDAANLDPTPPVVTLDTTDGFRPFPPIADLTASASEPLDPSSVTETTVTLEDMFGTSIPGTVTYDDATRMIRFDPDAALRTRWPYRFSVDGVRDLAGNPQAAAASAGFETHRFVSRVSEFRSASGTVNFRQVLDYVDGRRIASRDFDDPGPDAAWGTADDVISRLRTIEITAGQEITRTFAAGTDGVLDTADDVISGLGVATTDGYRSQRGVGFGPGPDGILGTSDDLLTSRQERAYPDGSLETRVEHFDAGPDGVFMTPDDFPSNATRTTADPFGRALRIEGLDDPGADAIFFTADDGLSSLATFDVSADGSTRTRRVLSAGADGVYDTADDVTVRIEIGTFDVDGVSARQELIRDPGPDGVFLTADDAARSGSVATSDADGNVTFLELYRGPGADGVMFTADDVLDGEVRQSFE